MGPAACCEAQEEVRVLDLGVRGRACGRRGAVRPGVGARVWARGSGARTRTGPPRGCCHRSLGFLLFRSVLRVADMTAPAESPLAPLLETLEDPSAPHGEQTDAYLTLTR